MLASLQQTIASSQAVQHVPKDKVAPTSRPWLKVRLPAESLEAVRVVGGWRSERRAASTTVKAILLWDAIERGDLDAVREICPLLGPALNAPTKKPKTKSAPPKTLIQEDSESSDSEKGVQAVAQAVAEVTGSDLLVNQRAIMNLAHKLVRASYTDEDVHYWYTGWWRAQDWRGKKGERPKLKDVQELIGQVRTLKPLPEGSSPTDATNPYLQDEYFARHTDADLEPEPQPASELQPQAASAPEFHVPNWAQNGWLAAKGQLEVQLNRATFDTWLKHTQPVHFAGDRNGGTLYVSVPHRYAKDWIDKHLRTALNKSFDALLNYDGQTKRRISPEALFVVEIVVEGDGIDSIAGMCMEPLIQQPAVADDGIS